MCMRSAVTYRRSFEAEVPDFGVRRKGLPVEDEDNLSQLERVYADYIAARTQQRPTDHGYTSTRLSRPGVERPVPMGRPSDPFSELIDVCQDIVNHGRKDSRAPQDPSSPAYNQMYEEFGNEIQSLKRQVQFMEKAWMKMTPPTEPRMRQESPPLGSITGPAEPRRTWSSREMPSNTFLPEDYGGAEDPYICREIMDPSSTCWPCEPRSQSPPGLSPPPGLVHPRAYAGERFVTEQSYSQRDQQRFVQERDPREPIPSQNQRSRLPASAFHSDHPTECSMQRLSGSNFHSAPASTQKRSNQFPSKGSMRHFSGKCKPCLLWHEGQCTKGSACLFCHIEHDAASLRRVRPSKRTREQLKKVREENYQQEEDFEEEGPIVFQL